MLKLVCCVLKAVNCEDNYTMSKPKLKRSDFFRRLNTHYRVVFIDDESLEEMASYRLTMRKIYTLLSTIFVLIAALSLCLLMFTPLKYYIPGYGGGSTRSEIIRLKSHVDSLKDVVIAQERYEQNLRQVITGDVEKERDTTLLNLKKVKEEEINQLLPQTEDIKKDAIKNVPKEKNSNKK